MSLSNQEIQNGSVSLFDHVKDGVDKIEINSILRLIDYTALLERELIDQLISRLTDEDIFRQLIKARCKSAQASIKSVTADIYERYGHKKGTSLSHLSDEAEGNIFFSDDAVQKMADSMIRVFNLIEGLTNISGYHTDEETHNFFVDNSTFLCKIPEGDNFMFIDQEQATEYTYKKTLIKKDGIYSIYEKQTEGLEFSEDNPFRPVVNTSILSSKLKGELLTMYETHKKRLQGTNLETENNK